MLKVHEMTTADGSLQPVFLFLEGDVLFITSDDANGKWALPDSALPAVMRRFGKPLEPSEPVALVDALTLGDGRCLRHVRHLARYDVIAHDWLVYDVSGEESLCALATTVAGALAHLGRAAASSNEP